MFPKNDEERVPCFEVLGHTFLRFRHEAITEQCPTGIYMLLDWCWNRATLTVIFPGDYLQTAYDLIGKLRCNSDQSLWPDDDRLTFESVMGGYRHYSLNVVYSSGIKMFCRKM